MHNKSHNHSVSASVIVALFILMALGAVNRAQAQWTTSGNNIYNSNSGNVGIGTTSPGEKLVTIGNSVTGNITSRTQLYSTYDSQGNVSFEVGYGTATANITPLPILVLSKNLTSANNALGNIFFANSSIANGSEKRMSGIGSWTDGATNSGNLIFYTSATGTLNERLRINSVGNVGIGTTSPGVPLTVAADGNALAVRAWRNGNAAGWGVAGLRLALNNSSGAATDYAGINGVIATNTAGAEDGALTFWTMKAGTMTEQTRIDKNGNLGIGTTSPTAKLDVTGNGRFTGNLTIDGTINAKYQDVAEWVESSQSLPAGTVVVLDHTRSNQVVASSEAYDTRVAGVISAQPGISLGEKSDTKVLVATTGRVKVKVDASAGPIHIGDLLVTSEVTGAAMKSEPVMVGGRRMHSPGTLIGKALEPLEGGVGEILVLLALQ